MKIQYSADAQHNAVTNKNDEIVISYQATNVEMKFDAIALMRGLGALFVAFDETSKAVNLLTSTDGE